jgi:2-methylcitrate dehydratase PrpD
LLESKLGYFATAATAASLDSRPWVEHWALAQPRRKLHACCGYLHSAVDAAGQLRRQLDGDLGHGEVEVHVPAYTADAVSKQRPPQSANDARFHLQFCLALVLCGADVIEPAHSIDYSTHLAREDVAHTMARIRVVVDPALTHYQQCRVVVRGQGVELGACMLEAPRGSPSSPLTDADVVAKFLRLAELVLQPARARQVVDAVEVLGAGGSAADLVGRLAL